MPELAAFTNPGTAGGFFAQMHLPDPAPGRPSLFGKPCSTARQGAGIAVFCGWHSKPAGSSNRSAGRAAPGIVPGSDDLASSVPDRNGEALVKQPEAVLDALYMFRAVNHGYQFHQRG